jgi:hypothetical protein
MSVTLRHPWASTRLRAAASISGLRSTPTIDPCGPTLSLDERKVDPSPARDVDHRLARPQIEPLDGKAPEPIGTPSAPVVGARLPSVLLERKGGVGTGHWCSIPRDVAKATWEMIAREREPFGDLLKEVDVPLLLAKHEGCLGMGEEGFEDAVAVFPHARTVSVPEAPVVSTPRPACSSLERGPCQS